MISGEATTTDPATDAGRGPRRARAWAGYALRCTLSLLVLTLLVRSISWSEIRQTLSGANRSLLAAACLLAVPIVVLKGIKWRVMLRDARIQATLGRTALSYMAGLGFGLVTPGRLGELARVGFLGLGRRDMLRAGVLVVLDRLTDLLALLILLTLSVHRFLGTWVALAWVVLGAGGTAVAITVLRRLRARGEDVPAQRFFGRVVAALDGVTPGALTRYVLMGLAVTMLGVVMVFLLLNALRPVPFHVCLVGLPPVFVNGILPVSVGGVGIREWLMKAVFGHMQVEAAAAVPAIMIYSLATMFLPGMIGLAVGILTRPRRQHTSVEWRLDKPDS